jgi:hypothetical protein
MILDTLIFKFQKPLFYDVFISFGKNAGKHEPPFGRAKRILGNYNRTPDATRLNKLVWSKQELLSKLEARQAPSGFNPEKQIKRLRVEIAESSLEYSLGLKKFARLSQASHALLNKLDKILAKRRAEINQLRQG